MKKTTGLAAIFLFLWGTGILLAQEVPRAAEALNRWTTKGTTLVLHVDLEKLQLRGMVEELLEMYKPLLKRTLSTENQLTQGLQMVEMVLEEVEHRSAMVKEAGGGDVFILVDTDDMSMPVYAVIPIRSSDSEAVAAVENLLKDFPLVPEEAQTQMDAVLHVGQARDAVVFIPSQFPLEKDLKADYVQEFLSRKTFEPNEKFTRALAQTEGCSLNLAFVMTDFTRGMLPTLLNQARKDENLPVTLPKASVLIDGLDSVVLGIDIRQNIGKLTILAKDDQAAEKLMKVYRVWNKQVLKKIEEEADDTQDPLTRALVMDMVDMYFQALKPTCQGNLILWDVHALPKNVPVLGEANVYPVAVAGVAIGLLLPAVQQARQSARKMQYTNNFKQVALAMLDYQAAFERYPSPYTLDEEGKLLHSWRVALLPFIEQQALYEQIRLDEPWDSEWNSQFHNICPPPFRNPQLNLEPNQATIGVVVGAETVFPAPDVEKKRNGVKLDEIQDGTFNTILLVECQPVCWMDPTGDPTYEDLLEEGLISTFFFPLVAMCDGSVHTLSEFLNPEVLSNLLRRNDGEEVSLP